MKNDPRRNLIPGGSHTAEGRRENGRLGGVASGRARNLKTAVNRLLQKQTGKGRAANIDTVPFDELIFANVTVEEKIALEMVLKAMNGDIKAAEWIRDTSGQKPTDTSVVTTNNTSENPFDGLTKDQLIKLAEMDD